MLGEDRHRKTHTAHLTYCGSQQKSGLLEAENSGYQRLERVCPCAGTNYLAPMTSRSRGLFWFLVSESAAPGHLAPRQEYRGGRIRWSSQEGRTGESVARAMLPGEAACDSAPKGSFSCCAPQWADPPTSTACHVPITSQVSLHPAKSTLKANWHTRRNPEFGLWSRLCQTPVM